MGRVGVVETDHGSLHHQRTCRRIEGHRCSSARNTVITRHRSEAFEIRENQRMVRCQYLAAQFTCSICRSMYIDVQGPGQ